MDVGFLNNKVIDAGDGNVTLSTNYIFEVEGKRYRLGDIIAGHTELREVLQFGLPHASAWNEIWVAGYPSFCGGADTELLHNIDLWREHGVGVHLVPMFGFDADMKSAMYARGCVTHVYRPDIFKGKIVASFCNDQFLARLPEIMAQGKPAHVVWFNCMTWAFEDELEAHQNGWINQFGFVSRYQRQQLLPVFKELAPAKVFKKYRPYFNPSNAAQQIEFRYREPGETFTVGRISRDDAAKYSEDMWSVFDKVRTPKKKSVVVLGYGPNARKKTGSPPAGLDVTTWEPNAVPVKSFYEGVHAVIHKTGGSRESYCRIVPECYAYGVPVIVEDDYAFPELVVDGVTGFRCKTSEEMSERATELAFDEPKRKRMILAARDYLQTDIANPDRCWQPWRKLFDSIPTATRMGIFDPPAWGPTLWAEIHAFCRDFKGSAEELASKVADFLARVPCGDCKDHAKEWLAANEADLNDLFAWSVRWHNSVNARTGKVEMPLEAAVERWRPS